jgi:hypothetical protein
LKRFVINCARTLRFIYRNLTEGDALTAEIKAISDQVEYWSREHTRLFEELQKLFKSRRYDEFLIVHEQLTNVGRRLRKEAAKLDEY